ncbi:hypothetical protein, partial [Desulfobacter postgatei]|uniref:hypothetical protein n=1 Tax=Desulfobacter postgatei TaxID=2293 RepID=UPI00259BDA06
AIGPKSGQKIGWNLDALYQVLQNNVFYNDFRGWYEDLPFIFLKPEDENILLECLLNLYNPHAYPKFNIGRDVQVLDPICH